MAQLVFSSTNILFRALFMERTTFVTIFFSMGMAQLVFSSTKIFRFESFSWRGRHLYPSVFSMGMAQLVFSSTSILRIEAFHWEGDICNLLFNISMKQSVQSHSHKNSMTDNTFERKVKKFKYSDASVALCKSSLTIIYLRKQSADTTPFMVQCLNRILIYQRIP